MPYQVIGDKCRVGGRLIPKGTTLADNQILGAAASALVAAKQLAIAPAAAAPAQPTTAKPASVKVAG